MFARFQIHFVLLLTVAILSGCTPQPRREKTDVKSAADVVIQFDDLSIAEEKEEPVEKAAAPVKSGGSTPAVASPKKEMAAATETPKPAATAAEKAPSTSSYTGPAKFVGRVVVKGSAPKLADLLAQGAATKDLFCSEMAVPNETVVVSKDGGLANVFVYMKKAPKTGVPEYSGEPFVVDQKGCVFEPHAQVVRVGQPFILKNADPVAHNVRYNGFAYQFNDTVGAGATEGLTKVIEFPERLPSGMVCDFHVWMTAYVLAVNHPWAAVTDADGNFEIADLPEGKWDFVIWHEKMGYVERSFKVTAAPNVLTEEVFEVNASKLSQ